jgi:hypothetical protein
VCCWGCFIVRLTGWLRQVYLIAMRESVSLVCSYLELGLHTASDD